MNTYKLDCGHLAVSDSGDPPRLELPCPLCGDVRGIVDQVNKPQVSQTTAILGPDGKDTGETVTVPVSPVTNGTPPERSYGCSWGCGNPYDYVFVSVADGTTEFLCLPCYLKLAEDIIVAVVSPEGQDVMAALKLAGGIDAAPMRGKGARPRGKNAPANSEDPDLIDAFDSRLTVDELPEEFT